MRIFKFFAASLLVILFSFMFNPSFTNILHAGEFLVEAKGAYFRSTDHKFRKIYSNGGLFSGEINYQAWNNIYAWASGGYFYKKGSSIGLSNSTKITLVPVGFGLKYLYSCNCFDFYVGAGAQPTYVYIKDNSSFAIGTSSKWTWGGIVKVGAIWNIRQNFFIDLFADYSFTDVKFHRTNNGAVTRQRADLSGWSLGAGIGYRFGVCCR